MTAWSGVARAGSGEAHGIPMASVASTTVATIRLSDSWRRIRYRRAHSAPHSLGSSFAIFSAAWAGTNRSPREVAAGRCRLGISDIPDSRGYGCARPSMELGPGDVRGVGLDGTLDESSLTESTAFRVASAALSSCTGANRLQG